MRKFLILAAICFTFSSCTNDTADEGEDYGNLLDSPEGLVLTQAEHEAGWGKSTCTLCHNLENIHLVDRTGLGIDIETIHEQAIANGIGECATCHGSNGVTP